MQTTSTAVRTATRGLNKATRSMANSRPKHTGLLPFQPRPPLPKEIIKEAKRLHMLGISITDIQRVLSDPKCYIKVQGVKNQDFNYYDFWDLLGYNKRKLEHAA